MKIDSDIEILYHLNQKVHNHTATPEETDEYMRRLHENNNINDAIYNRYRSNTDTEDIINAAVTIGGIVLLGYIIGKLAGK